MDNPAFPKLSRKKQLILMLRANNFVLHKVSTGRYILIAESWETAPMDFNTIYAFMDGYSLALDVSKTWHHVPHPANMRNKKYIKGEVNRIIASTEEDHA